MNIEFELRWALQQEGGAQEIDPRLFSLLAGVARAGSLSEAARRHAISYRLAWGLVREWEKRFGQPLLSARRGRGASLTAFGQALVREAAAIEQRLSPILTSAAVDTTTELTKAAAHQKRSITIVSSHNERIRELRDALSSRFNVRLEIAGSGPALTRFRHGDADVVGFHLPMGALGRIVGAKLIEQLDPQTDRIYLLEQRTLGLLSRSDAIVRSLSDLVRSKRQFINRQAGSGTRLAFDGLLAEHDLNPEDVVGYDTEEYTHSAVAAVVASGSADAGFATEQAALQLGLHFERLVDERFYLALASDADSVVRRTLADFCANQSFPDQNRMKSDEFTPTIASLKRIHRAGFWKSPPASPSGGG